MLRVVVAAFSYFIQHPYHYNYCYYYYYGQFTNKWQLFNLPACCCWRWLMYSPLLSSRLCKHLLCYMYFSLSQRQQQHICDSFINFIYFFSVLYIRCFIYLSIYLDRQKSDGCTVICFDFFFFFCTFITFVWIWMYGYKVYGACFIVSLTFKKNKNKIKIKTQNQLCNYNVAKIFQFL